MKHNGYDVMTSGHCAHCRVLGKYQHVSPVVFLCQPKKEDYSMLTKQQKKDITSSLAKEDYVALLKERPWMPILELSVRCR